MNSIFILQLLLSLKLYTDVLLNIQARKWTGAVCIGGWNCGRVQERAGWGMGPE